MKDATLPPATYTPKVMTLHATAPMTHDPDEAKRLCALHAAAPDLLAACKELVALWELEGGHFLKSDSPSIKRARAAIKKAEGKDAAQ